MCKTKAFFKKYFTYDGANGVRANNFNIIRFIAAAMVIYGHMCHIMGVPVYGIYSQAVSSIAVKVLFTVSGYLIMKSYNSDGNLFRYTVKRAFRIFPGLIGVVLFGICVGAVTSALPFSQYITHPSTVLYLKNIILYPIYSLPGVFANYTYPNAVNGSLWTLPIEFALYFVLPLFLFVFRKLKIEKPGLITLSLITVAADVLHLTVFPTARFVLYGTDWFQSLAILPYFFAGAVFALPGFNKLFNLQLSSLFMVLLLIFNFSEAKTELIFCFVLPYFVLSAALCEKPVFANWFSKGEFSYGLYLFGFPVQQLIAHQLQKTQNPVFSLNVTFIICFAATFVCAVCSWYLIEKPAQNIGKRIVENHKRKHP